MSKLSFGTWLVITLNSLIKSSITFLVYEAALLICWFTGIIDSLLDHKSSLYHTHSICYSRDIDILLYLSTTIFLYNLYSYAIASKRYLSECDNFDA